MSPNASTAASTTVAAPSTLATSAAFAMATPPLASIAATTPSAAEMSGGVGSSPRPPSPPTSSRPTSFTRTLAPSAASASACARPSPLPAPVTTATFPSRRPIAYLSLRVGGSDRAYERLLRDTRRERATLVVELSAADRTAVRERNVVEHAEHPRTAWRLGEVDGQVERQRRARPAERQQRGAVRTGADHVGDEPKGAGAPRLVVGDVHARQPDPLVRHRLILGRRDRSHVELAADERVAHVVVCALRVLLRWPHLRCRHVEARRLVDEP